MIYYPADELSKQALASIPKKVHAWITFLGEGDITEIGPVSWKFEPEPSADEQSQHYYITIALNDCDVTLYWTHGVNGITEPQFIGGTEPWMLDIAKNLDKFVALEKSIYDVIDNFEKQIQTHKDLKFLENVDTVDEELSNEDND